MLRHVVFRKAPIKVQVSMTILLFDWSFIHVTRQWLYTAITRATYLSKVRFYSGSSEKFKHELLKRYLNDEIEGYKQQDKKAKRPTDSENYINLNWLVKCFKTCCTSCGTSFEATVSFSGNLRCNLTANRIDNELGHDIDNIEPMCVSCNSSLSNK